MIIPPKLRGANGHRLVLINGGVMGHRSGLNPGLSSPDGSGGVVPALLVSSVMYDRDCMHFRSHCAVKSFYHFAGRPILDFSGKIGDGAS